jgi:hypothetical protein
VVAGYIGNSPVALLWLPFLSAKTEILGPPGSVQPEGPVVEYRRERGTSE